MGDVPQRPSTALLVDETARRASTSDQGSQTLRRSRKTTVKISMRRFEEVVCIYRGCSQYGIDKEVGAIQRRLRAASQSTQEGARLNETPIKVIVLQEESDKV